MPINAQDIEGMAARLEAAELNVQAVDKVTDDYPDLTITEAYKVQRALIDRKRDKGHSLIGLKMGLTSRAKMRQMAVDLPVYGSLLDYFVEPESGEIDTGRFIHPRVEAELALITRSPLRGPGCHVGTVMQATDCVVPAVEIIDSRYRDFQFDLPSVIADNTSASGFMVGSQMLRSGEADLQTLGVVLERNGDVVEVGAGAAVLGNPLSSVALLANLLAEREEEIPAGSLVLTGGITAAVPMNAGDSFRARFQGLGAVAGRFA